MYFTYSIYKSVMSGMSSRLRSLITNNRWTKIWIDHHSDCYDWLFFHFCCSWEQKSYILFMGYWTKWVSQPFSTVFSKCQTWQSYGMIFQNTCWDCFALLCRPAVPNLLFLGTSFMEDNFSTDWGGRWFQDVHFDYIPRDALILFILQQLHLSSSGIKSQRLGTPELRDVSYGRSAFSVCCQLSTQLVPSPCLNV